MTAYPAQRRPDAAKVLNALAQPLLTVDAQGMVIDVNVAAETFFDMGRGMLVRSQLTDLIPSELAGFRPCRRRAQQSRDRQRL